MGKQGKWTKISQRRRCSMPTWYFCKCKWVNSIFWVSRQGYTIGHQKGQIASILKLKPQASEIRSKGQNKIARMSSKIICLRIKRQHFEARKISSSKVKLAGDSLLSNLKDRKAEQWEIWVLQ